jgi:HEAT repeat protein
LVKQAFDFHADENESQRAFTDEERSALLASEDWKARYAALTSMGSDPRYFDTLLGLMGDPNASVRRLATVYLGLTRRSEGLTPLAVALKDPSVAVRRSAGDALNDLGDQALTNEHVAPAVAEALKDANKLVRWRAARFFFELGDATALPALKAAEADPEFEVCMQIRQAIERIEGGKAALGPIWMQMTSSRSARHGPHEAP